jgi:integrase
LYNNKNATGSPYTNRPQPKVTTKVKQETVTMSASNSNGARPQSKPKKPSRSFPLCPHSSGKWAKKIRGRIYYFGTWADPQGALAEYNDRKEALHSGKAERPSEGVTVGQLAIKFLTFKKTRLQADMLTDRTFERYGRACNHVLATFGRGRLVSDLGPDDFEKLYARWVKLGWGPVTFLGFIKLVKAIFKFGFDFALIDKPIRFGPGFAKPDQKTLRTHRAKKGKMLFSRDELLTMLDAAEPRLRAMILLGINCGFGNGDCAALTLAALDLAGGWHNLGRPKTGIPRRCALWPETIAALRVALRCRYRPQNPADAGLVFLTKFGRPWHKATWQSPLSEVMKRFLDGLNINGGRNFYCLRRGFETVGGASRDQVAVDFIMGHAPHSNDMAAVYRQEIDDDRLKAVTDHVRQWLFGKAQADPEILKLA